MPIPVLPDFETQRSAVPHGSASGWLAIDHIGTFAGETGGGADVATLTTATTATNTFPAMRVGGAVRRLVGASFMGERERDR